MPPSLKKLGGGAELLHVLVLKNTFTMYLTIPVTSATSERTFSALRRLKNYLRSTMKQDHLNNCLLMSFHKLITDALDTVKIACANEQRTQRAFWKICVGVSVWLSGRWAPQVSKRSAASVTDGQNMCDQSMTRVRSDESAFLHSIHS